MAPNRKPKLRPERSSSEEEGSGSGSESEDNNASPQAKKPTTTSTKKPDTPQKTPPAPSSSDEESGSDSGSDSDSPPENPREPDPNIKPIATKPMEVLSKPTSPTPLAGSKRPAESEPKGTHSTKKKVEAVGSGSAAMPEDPKKLFQRLWSEDDEIAMLKGMIEYTAKKGADPVVDMNVFYDFIKKSLHFDCSKTQLADKVRRLKNKYVNNARKEKKKKGRTFSKAHEQKAYEISKDIWGKERNGGGVNVGNSTASGTARKAAQSQSSKVNNGLKSPQKEVDADKAVGKVKVGHGVSSLVPCGSGGRGVGDAGLVEEYIRGGLELLGDEKRTELEGKWRNLWLHEAEVFAERAELMGEQVKAVVEAIKSKGYQVYSPPLAPFICEVYVNELQEWQSCSKAGRSKGFVVCRSLQRTMGPNSGNYCGRDVVKLQTQGYKLGSTIAIANFTTDTVIDFIFHHYQRIRSLMDCKRITPLQAVIPLFSRT
ncbi:hypothetical protein RJ639_014579 [Escallonia herrerae]|uniref:Glabrous enhancer-binding protein-like DBD domain-containing protein n=1 Tax=Escallonia herrerae TaxID=1293975 RepID=A0AA89AN10_9ASTE|nr:hypothetical protein RJ639_014579 [Escallonia herrerae]